MSIRVFSHLLFLIPVPFLDLPLWEASKFLQFKNLISWPLWVSIKLLNEFLLLIFILLSSLGISFSLSQTLVTILLLLALSFMKRDYGRNIMSMYLIRIVPFIWQQRKQRVDIYCLCLVWFLSFRIILWIFLCLLLDVKVNELFKSCHCASYFKFKITVNSGFKFKNFQIYPKLWIFGL